MDVGGVMSCPACNNGHASVLGALGRLIWYRCRDCGAEYSHEAPEDDGWDDAPAQSSDQFNEPQRKRERKFEKEIWR